MYALCVSGAVNTQGFVWKFFYALYINLHSFIHLVLVLEFKSILFPFDSTSCKHIIIPSNRIT